MDELQEGLERLKNALNNFATVNERLETAAKAVETARSTSNDLADHTKVALDAVRRVTDNSSEIASILKRLAESIENADMPGRLSNMDTKLTTLDLKLENMVSANRQEWSEHKLNVRRMAVVQQVSLGVSAMVFVGVIASILLPLYHGR